jgi:hypothetical protein
MVLGQKNGEGCDRLSTEEATLRGREVGAGERKADDLRQEMPRMMMTFEIRGSRLTWNTPDGAATTLK